MAVLILISGFLSSCSTKKTEADVSVSNSIQRIEKARELTKEVNMVLLSERDGDELNVKIMLDNPEQKPITSVQSWLSYDPEALEGVEIEVTDSPFAFTAPYENTFDEVNGLVMIGRGNAEPVTDKEINVASVVFKVTTDDITMIDIYDYQNDLSGHASANMMMEGVPYNILKKSDSPALVINN